MTDLICDSLRFFTNTVEKKGSYTYNFLKGFWENSSGVPLIDDANGVNPGTKKCDVETGEDVKGE
ncbi:hypothetical protein LF599_05465 [Pseudodesulfovibrio thermohalotolerans]|uniref:hypothetical protein n=1 Tax=Pseudodesulfovibrio thermohalotolerans TaxID=2880651 RepID=UPI0024426518|nr:hypothetical protein [Pseudodesulfovibrio thermohalotolerans]WFS63613.1 hypothetical protein LF599_05465 [Pseudodesulfovibrio thermohalotolerans]